MTMLNKLKIANGVGNPMSFREINAQPMEKHVQNATNQIILLSNVDNKGTASASCKKKIWTN